MRVLQRTSRVVRGGLRVAIFATVGLLEGAVGGCGTTSDAGSPPVDDDAAVGNHGGNGSSGGASLAGGSAGNLASGGGASNTGGAVGDSGGRGGTGGVDTVDGAPDALGAAGATDGGGAADGGGGTVDSGDAQTSLESGVAEANDASIPQIDASALRSGPFNLLVFNTTFEFQHDSIPNGQAMLVDLGKTPDGMLPTGAQPGSQFTVTVAKDDLSDFSTANLAKYEVIFWLNPSGTVFSSSGANGIAAKAAVQTFMEQQQGAWAGVHSALDFERTNKWPWFQNMAGGYTVTHLGDGTASQVLMEAAAIASDHPAIRGLPTSWSCSDEWWSFNRDPGQLSGFQVLGKLAYDLRPVSWVHDLPVGGRAFYTSRGHNKTVYAEPEFRKHVHQGILWAVHRMK